jgi:F-box and WD-40 domain protein 1/11
MCVVKSWITDLLPYIDRTVRTYSFPDLVPQFVLGAHRAAVNAVSISKTLIVSGSGDRSIRLWDAKTGKLLRTFENHHSRGCALSLCYQLTDIYTNAPIYSSNPHRIASIDFTPPLVVSGSSDKHLRLFDITTSQGWSTSPDFDNAPSTFLNSLSISNGAGVNAGVSPTSVCQACGHMMASATGQGDGGNVIGCGSGASVGVDRTRCVHGDLVRSVALGEEFVLSGSYDLSIKVRTLILLYSSLLRHMIGLADW